MYRKCVIRAEYTVHPAVFCEGAVGLVCMCVCPLSPLHGLWILVLRSGVREEGLLQIYYFTRTSQEPTRMCVCFFRGASRSPFDIRCPICQGIARTYMMLHHFSALPPKECVYLAVFSCRGENWVCFCVSGRREGGRRGRGGGAAVILRLSAGGHEDTWLYRVELLSVGKHSKAF